MNVIHEPLSCPACGVALPEAPTLTTQYTESPPGDPSLSMRERMRVVKRAGIIEKRKCPSCGVWHRRYVETVNPN